ncbi:MAG: hypothetical protein CMH56_13575 [Myxococcales bacterium]|nr:hypothetical protein [Myxococcales bacterium]
MALNCRGVNCARRFSEINPIQKDAMFSIITPVLNGMPYLPQAVRSVAEASEGVVVQHIIMDGGSTDGTLRWLEDNQDYGYEIVSGKDSSQSEALIKGFERAHGRYLAWLNADDLLEPDALAKVHRAFSTSDAWVAVSGAALVINGENEIIGSTKALPNGELSSLLGHLQNIPQPSTFFRRDIYNLVAGINLNLNYAMDVDLWLQLAKHGPIHVMKNEILSRVRIHDGAKTVNNQDATAREDLMVRLKHGMSLTSKNSLHLSKRGFIYPCLRPFQKLAKRALAKTPLKHNGK